MEDQLGALGLGLNWAEAAEVMRSYRIYKSGDPAEGRGLASRIPGPLAQALTAWYDHLDRAAALLERTSETARLSGGPGRSP